MQSGAQVQRSTEETLEVLLQEACRVHACEHAGNRRLLCYGRAMCGIYYHIAGRCFAAVLQPQCCPGQEEVV